MAWSPDNTILASAGTDPTIRLWNVPEGTQRAALHGHTSGVCGLAFTPDGRSLLSCSDGTLRMWDIASGWNLDTGTYLRTLWRERPYERMNITGLTGITANPLTEMLDSKKTTLTWPCCLLAARMPVLYCEGTGKRCT